MWRTVATREAGADASTEADASCKPVVGAEEDLERRRTRLEARVCEHGAPECLGAHHQASIRDARAGRGAVDDLVADRTVRECARLGIANHRAELRRVGEEADISGREQARRGANASVAAVARGVAGGHKELTADRHRERAVVSAEQPQIDAEAQVAEALRGGRRRIAHAAELRGLAVAEEHDGETDAEAEPVGHHQRAAEVRGQHAADHRSSNGAVALVDHERAVLVVRHHAERRPRLASHVERLEHEPAAPSFGRLETVHREAGLLSAGSAGSGKGRSEDARNRAGCSH